MRFLELSHARAAPRRHVRRGDREPARATRAEDLLGRPDAPAPLCSRRSRSCCAGWPASTSAYVFHPLGTGHVEDDRYARASTRSWRGRREVLHDRARGHASPCPRAGAGPRPSTIPARRLHRAGRRAGGRDPAEEPFEVLRPADLRRPGMGDAAGRAALGGPERVLQAAPAQPADRRGRRDVVSTSTRPSTCTRRWTRCRERSNGTARWSRRACWESFRSTAAGPTATTCATPAGSAPRSSRSGRRPVAVELVRWWAERLARGRHAPTDRTASRPLRPSAEPLARPGAPSVFADVAVLDDPGSALSHWNVHERTPRAGRRRRSRWTAAPLRFVHFEGFDPARPFLLQPRRRTGSAPAPSPALAALCESYAERLRRGRLGATPAGAPTSAAGCRTA